MSTTVAATSRPLVHGWLHEVTLINERAEHLARTLSDEQLYWKPPTGAWSIAQVFEHLTIATADYLAPMRAACLTAEGTRGSGEWKPSLAGRLLVRALRPESTGALPAPARWRPADPPGPRVIEHFLRVQAELADLLLDSEPLDLTGIRTRSPITPLIRLNLGDCFEILTVHARRHLVQIERVRQVPGFPPDAPGTD